MDLKTSAVLLIGLLLVLAGQLASFILAAKIVWRMSQGKAPRIFEGANAKGSNAFVAGTPVEQKKADDKTRRVPWEP